MKKRMEYEECKIEIIYFEEADVITESIPEGDDFDTPGL
jgi:hypothetical protein